MYFLGVTTGSSSIHAIFPAWSRLAGVADAELTGLDLPVGASAAACREAIGRLLADPESRGALITSHKVGVFRHAADLFDELDEDARRLQEISCVVQRGNSLRGEAIDTLTGRLALDHILGGAVFGSEALILGAGGAGLALAVVLERHHRPSRVTLTDVSPPRLAEITPITSAELQLVETTGDHDRLIEALPAGSLIINATGVGKDRPGSPVTTAAKYPDGAIAWDLNYRGNLAWLERAGGVDGWNYFLHGWSQIMSRVFDFEVTPELFAQFEREAVLKCRP